MTIGSTRPGSVAGCSIAHSQRTKGSVYSSSRSTARDSNSLRESAESTVRRFLLLSRPGPRVRFETIPAIRVSLLSDFQMGQEWQVVPGDRSS